MQHPLHPFAFDNVPDCHQFAVVRQWWRHPVILAELEEQMNHHCLLSTMKRLDVGQWGRVDM